MSFLQENNVIHRDINPNNLIKRQQTNKIVLIDFGAVKEVIYPHNEKTTIGIHTRGYAANEQLIGKPRYSSDVYAVGMVTIEALTGNSPLSLIQEASDEVEWGEYLTEVLKHKVSDELISILGKMTHPDYKQRYSLAKEALTEINDLNSHPISKNVTTLSSTPTKEPPTNNNVTVNSQIQRNMTTIPSLQSQNLQMDDDVKFNRKKWVIVSVLLVLFGGMGGYIVFDVVDNLNEPPKDQPGLFNNF